jgi:hypothetical protein
MEPLNTNDAQRYAAFMEWTPFEAALLLAGCKPLPRGHVPKPSGNTPEFNLLSAVQVCGPSKDLETPHPPEVWMRWYSEYLAGRNFPVFSKVVMLALEQENNKDTSKVIVHNAQPFIQDADPQLAVLQGSGKVSSPAATIDRGWVLKKKALIEKHRSKWITIERDFRDASSNHLTKMAKAPGHGNWFEADALKWAEVRGKLNVNEINPFSTTLFPTTKYRI